MAEGYSMAADVPTRDGEEIADMMFRDRADAGRQLGAKLSGKAPCKDVVVLGIPRGGLVVAYQVARSLNAPLDVFLSAKLPVPEQEELAFGAMVEDGSCYLNEEIIRAAHVSTLQIESSRKAAADRLREKAQRYRLDRGAVELRGRPVILVDDGIATGASMQVSIQALTAMEVGRLTVAVPVAPAATGARLRLLLDEFICLIEPKDFGAVSQFYAEFQQTSDDEVAELLRRATTLGP